MYIYHFFYHIALASSCFTLNIYIVPLQLMNCLQDTELQLPEWKMMTVWLDTTVANSGIGLVHGPSYIN